MYENSPAVQQMDQISEYVQSHGNGAFIMAITYGTPGWAACSGAQNNRTGWAGYDFIVDRDGVQDGKAWLEKNTGGWALKKVAPVSIQVKGNEMQLAIPKAALGLPSDANRTNFDFKWDDNLQKPGDVADFYLDGDVAPAGRFNYRYDTKESSR